MVDIDKVTIKRLIALRKSKGLTQEQVAENAGISRRYINKLENGHIKRLKFNMVVNYLDACKTNLVDFFADLERFIKKNEYDNILSQIKMPEDYRLRKKVSRDIELYHTKIKGKIGKAKLLSKESRNKAVVKFGNYRSKIEHIQSLAYKIIAKHAPDTTLNPFYRAFVNEIYKALKKNHSQHLSLDSGFDEIIKRWIKRGLKEEILIELRDVIVKYFEPEN